MKTNSLEFSNNALIISNTAISSNKNDLQKTKHKILYSGAGFKKLAIFKKKRVMQNQKEKCILENFEGL